MSRNIENPSFDRSKEALVCPPKIEIARPIGVDLFYSDLKEAQDRRELLETVANIFEKIPDEKMDIEDALENNLLSYQELSGLYQDLSSFLNSDLNNSHLILYLPFEILPNLKSEKTTPDDLRASQNLFIQSYQDAWIRLLFENEVRANFVDGDFLEPGLGDPVCVRKAAHLIPELLKKSIIQKEMIDDIVEINSDDPILLNSIKEGLIAYDCPIVEEDVQNNFDLAAFQNSLKLIDQNYNPESLPSAKEKYLNNSSDSRISIERAAWEKNVKRQELFNKTASKITDPKIIENLIEFNDPDPAYKIVGLKSIFNQDYHCNAFDYLISKNWNTGSNQVKEAIITGLSHWQKKGVITIDYLDQFGITIPDLSSPFPVNLEKLLSKDFHNLQGALENIKNNSILSENIYPLFLVFGSRVKGYSNLDSDQDLAIFFKPNTLWEQRESLLEQIREIPELKNIGKLTEFWTNEVDGKIGFRSVPEKVWGVVGPQQIQFLFGGVWISSEPLSKKIQQDIIEKYLDLSRFKDQKDQLRFYLLRQLEDDVLQCRLMHKGYWKYYPDKTNPKIKSLDSIDGKSAFWDPGYRRVATKLFLSRVLLPDLSDK